MNCSHCGAPLRGSEDGEQTVCAYCAAECLIVDGHLDGLVLQDLVGEYDCPCCQLPLTQATTRGVEIEICETCQGILFPPQTFALVVHVRRVNYKGADIVPRPLDPAQIIPGRDCPGCQSRMECHPYYGPGNAIIDSCARCSIVWLDRGELTLIERAPGQRRV